VLILAFAVFILSILMTDGYFLFPAAGQPQTVLDALAKQVDFDGKELRVSI
jgi:hypothetical protein